MTFTDEQLLDYLEGRLPVDLAQTLETQVAEDPVFEQRLLSFDQSRASGLRAAMESIPSDARIASLEAGVLKQGEGMAPAPVAKLRGWAPFAAGFAAMIAFAAGAFVFSGNASQVPDRWQEQVAVYQALYVTDTLRHTEPNAARAEAQLLRGQEALGRVLPLSAVGELDGLPLLRAQVLGFEGAPLIQMAYLTEDGVPVAFCAVRMSDVAEQAPQTEELYGLESIHWSDGDFSYMLVGDIAADRLSRMATMLQATF